MKVFGPEKPFQKPWSLLCRELFMSTGFAFKQSLHLCSVSNVRIFLVFQLRTFKVGVSGPKTFLDFRETGLWWRRPCWIDNLKPQLVTSRLRSLTRARNCDSLVANATKNWVLATRFSELVASWRHTLCPLTFHCFSINRKNFCI